VDTKVKIQNDIYNSIVRFRNHPALFRYELRAKKVSWISGQPPYKQSSFRCEAQTRYHMKAGNTSISHFSTQNDPQNCVSPRVLYSIYS
jgi:tRNA U34 2-thiouridine synthase MnmA/TrmU